MSRGMMVALSILLLPSVSTADPRDLDVFTSFEIGDTGPIFGDPPDTATFVGGSSMFVGNFSLYHSGSRSWQTPSSTKTTIDFETPAAVVEFFALDKLSPDAVITTFDADGFVIDSLNLTSSFPSLDFSNPFQFSGEIGSIEIDNPGGGNTWLDDFGYTTVPEPSALSAGLACLLALAWVATIRRRESWLRG